MIVSEDIKPDKSLYVVGAKIIELLKKESMGAYDIHVLYDKLITAVPYEQKISFSYFIHGLIWLYLLGLVNINDENTLIRCF